MPKDKPARRPGLRTRDSLPHKIKVIFLFVDNKINILDFILW